MRIESDCAQQRTGSCEGCPVLVELRNDVREVTINRPSRVTSELADMVDLVAMRSCPEGVKPQVEQLEIRSYGRGLGGRTVTVNLKR